MRLPKDFKEFIASLNGSGVKYLVVGGYAVAFHGHPRFTGDIDFLVAMEPDNAEKLVRALSVFGFGGDSVSPRLFLEPEKVIQFGRPPLRIDIVTSIDGVAWNEAWGNRVEAVFDGESVWVLSLDDLKKNKAASGRPRDLADLDALSG